MPTIRIALVDDHQLILDGLQSLLMGVPDLEVVGEANSGSELLAQLEALRPNVILLDVDMPGMGGRALAAEIRKRAPQIRMLALTMHHERSVIQGMRQAGVHGYLLKNTAQEELLQAIRRVAQGKSYYGHEVAEILLEPPAEPAGGEVSPAVLTQREREILILVAEGFSNTEIGDQLHISPRTVDTHRTNLMKKLRVRNLAGLIRYAFQQGLVG
ncbi:MAG: DNA-binding response regulator [Bacteroidetes bacterium]|nr:MAG: DNA-binding response regulator [Bacteroidota bacterium]